MHKNPSQNPILNLQIPMNLKIRSCNCTYQTMQIKPENGNKKLSFLKLYVK
jgi:hypothetical protein